MEHSEKHGDSTNCPVCMKMAIFELEQKIRDETRKQANLREKIEAINAIINHYSLVIDSKWRHVEENWDKPIPSQGCQGPCCKIKGE